MAEEFIIKVLDPGRVEEVLKWLESTFSRCFECGDYFDGAGYFCSPNCDLAYHSDPNLPDLPVQFPELST